MLKVPPYTVNSKPQTLALGLSGQGSGSGCIATQLEVGLSWASTELVCEVPWGFLELLAWFANFRDHLRLLMKLPGNSKDLSEVGISQGTALRQGLVFWNRTV